MEMPLELNKLTAIVIVRDRYKEAVYQRLAPLFKELVGVVTYNNFESNSPNFVKDLTYNHVRALEFGLNTKQPFVVLEEDAYPTQDYSVYVPNLPGVIKLDLNSHRPYVCPRTWAEEIGCELNNNVWYRVYCQYSTGSYLVNSVEEGNTLLKEFKNCPQEPADSIFISKMKELKFYCPERPLFYHGPASNPKAKRTLTTSTNIEKKWGRQIKRLDKATTSQH
jgi:hypothetical protein